MLSAPQLGANLSVEYTRGKNTVGMLLQNVFGNVYLNSRVVVNPYYQPVATGVAGPQTGQIPRANPVMEIPAEALIFNKDGTQVAVFENGAAHIRKVSLAEDDGDHVDIATGLKPDDKVIVSLPVDLTDGAPVAVREMKVAEKKS